MKKKSKKKIIIILLILTIIIVGGIACYFKFRKEEIKQEPKKVEVLDKIINYEYSLEDRDTKVYKEVFLELKEILESEEKEETKYAESVVKLFLIDLYTIDNKINKYDVGGLDFIYPEEKEKFQNKVMDTLYKLVEDNSTNTRKQELPVVSKIEITKTEKTKYKKGENFLNGFQINASLSYEKELGYDKKITVTVVCEKEKIYVVQTQIAES